MNSQPLAVADNEPVRHVDGGGTAHWFAIAERDEPVDGEPYELRYFREHELTDGTQRNDSYPVMPLANDDPQSAWALPGLEMYLEKGDVYMAQQFAHDVADAYEQDFPEPLDLHSLNPDPEYYFGYGVSEQNQPALEAVKTWMDGAERRFDTLTVGEYGTLEEAAVDELELEALKDREGVQAAMNLAESMAVAGGYLDPKRDDPRIFFEDDAPPDPFTTHRERELAGPEYAVGAISANGEHYLDVYKSWGDDSYERLTIPQPTWEDAQLHAKSAFTLQANGDLQGAMHLVEQAGMDAGVIDPERDDPRLFTQGPPDPFTTIRSAELSQETEITLNHDVDTQKVDMDATGYPALYTEFAQEAEREREAHATLEGAAWFEATFAKSDTELLQPIDDTVNYAVVVQDADPETVELAVEKYWNDANANIGISSVTLNTYDPDTGRELAERDREALMQVHDERGLKALMHKAELTAMEHGWLDGNRQDSRLFTEGPPDPFETLAQRLADEVNPYWNMEGEAIEVPETTVDNPYWRMETLPVNDPDGEPLGRSLHMVVYDGIEHDPESVGTPAIPDGEPFRMLEVAHFETTEAAEKFGKEFNGYLMPGLLDGPELAEEVAQLEGHPVEWKTLDGQELDDYRDLKLTLTRDPADWQPYNPNAERDARIEVEGLNTDPIQLDEGEDKPKVEPVTPDFDL